MREADRVITYHVCYVTLNAIGFPGLSGSVSPLNVHLHIGIDGSIFVSSLSSGLLGLIGTIDMKKILTFSHPK